MLRVKELQNALAEAQAEIRRLEADNRMLRVAEKRQEVTLSKYEGTHAQLPLIIKSYSEDIRTLQTRLRRTKGSYRKLEKQYRSQTAELIAMQKEHKHLLDLTKNKQLGERERLSNQLEEAEYTIKEQEKKVQTLLRKLELQSKNYKSQINVEVSKIKQLQSELNRLKEENDKLETKMERLKYQNYGGRRSYISGINGSSVAQAGPAVVRSKETSSSDEKPGLVRSESDVSDHTKDLQRNIMRQVHGDVIDRPDMLMRDETRSPNAIGSVLNRGISELTKGKDLSDLRVTDDTEERTETTVAGNPFSLSDTYGLTGTAKRRTTDGIVNETSVGTDKYSVPKLSTKKQVDKPSGDGGGDGDGDGDNDDDDDDDDDASSMSSANDTD